MLLTQMIDFDPLVKQIVQAVARELASMKPQPLLVSGDELAELISVSPSTVDRLTREDRIPSVKIGKLRRYNPDAVVAALEN